MQFICVNMSKKGRTTVTLSIMSLWYSSWREIELIHFKFRTNIKEASNFSEFWRRSQTITQSQLRYGDKHSLNAWLRALFTKFLTPGLTHEFCAPLDDWLDWLNLTNHQANYKIRGLTRELKFWWIRLWEF